MGKIKEKKKLPKNETGPATHEAYNRHDLTNRLKLENEVLNKVLEYINKGNQEK